MSEEKGNGAGEVKGLKEKGNGDAMVEEVKEGNGDAMAEEVKGLEEKKNGDVMAEEVKGLEEKGNGELNPLERKIIRQMEFYFGDRNLARDNFLQEKIKENEFGWVDLNILLTFNRLKALSTDITVIASALIKSSSDLLEVSDDGTKVRRKSSEVLPTLGLLSPEVRKDMQQRTLYIKGFPEDATLDDLEDYLLSFGDTELIKMKRFAGGEKDKQFKGSLFVEFKSLDSVKRILEMPEIKYKDIMLTVETKKNYFTRKAQEKKTTESSSVESSTPQTAKKQSIVRQVGAVLHFNGCGKDTTREYLKDYFRQFSSVSWVDFEKGQSEGYIRFEEENGGNKALEDLMQKSKGENPQLCGSETLLKVLEGAEEIAYWEKMALAQSKRKSHKKGSGHAKSFRGRRQKRSCHASSESNDEPALKASKQNED